MISGRSTLALLLATTVASAEPAPPRDVVDQIDGLAVPFDLRYAAGRDRQLDAALAALAP